MGRSFLIVQARSIIERRNAQILSDEPGICIEWLRMLPRRLMLTIAITLAMTLPITVGACSDGASSNSDANSDIDADSGIDAPPPIPCRPVVLGVGNGRHNAGKACLSCHNGSVARARIWTAAGTLFNKSGATLSGATITLIDATGKTFDLVSQENGNFYTDDPDRGSFQVCLKGSQGSRDPDRGSFQVYLGMIASMRCGRGGIIRICPMVNWARLPARLRAMSRGQ